MKRINYFLIIFLSIIIISCGGKKETPNLPPSVVSNVEAIVIKNTSVKISWQAAVDPNNDEISYDVVVNNKLIATKTSNNFVEFDALTLLPSNRTYTKSQLSARGAIELVIKIKAYDTNSNVSDELESKRFIFINRAPEKFEFIKITFDTNNYNSIDISWSKALDKDKDILSYDIYLNDLLLKKDYIIGSDNNQGNFNYNKSYAKYINDEFTIKIIANDRSGGVREISKSFNFKASDVNLETLKLPYEKTLDFNLEKEPDNKISYSFTISETTALLLTSTAQNYFYLKDSNGNTINSGSNRISSESLIAGNYSIEVDNNYYNNTSGSFNISLRNPKLTDVNLENLTIPYENTLNFNLEKEPDNKISYSFTISETTGFLLTSTSQNYFYLKDSNGNFINSGSNRIINESLTAGKYFIEVEGSYNNTSGSFNISLGNPKSTDVNLGSLTLPYQSTQNFSINTKEIDQKIGYSFAISEKAGLSLTSTDQIYFHLKDANGNYIDSSGNNRIIKHLEAGNYYLEVQNNQSTNSSGSFNLSVQKLVDSNVNLNEIDATYSNTFKYDTTFSPTKRTRYSFSIKSDVNYSFEITQGNYDTYLYLYDSSGNLIQSDDDGGNETLSKLTGTLSNGSYYVEVGGLNDNEFGPAVLEFKLSPK